MWPKIIQLAPVILATGATVGLLVVKIDDPRTKRIIRIIAVLLGIGTAFSLVQQIPTVLAAIGEGYAAAQRVLGIDDDSKLARIRKEAEVEAARAKAEADAIANRRRIEDEKRASIEATRRAKERDEEARRDAQCAQRREREEADNRRRAERQAEDEHRRRADAAREAAQRRQLDEQRRSAQLGCNDPAYNRFLDPLNCNKPHEFNQRWGGEGRRAQYGLAQQSPPWPAALS